MYLHLQPIRPLDYRKCHNLYTIETDHRSARSRSQNVMYHKSLQQVQTRLQTNCSRPSCSMHHRNNDTYRDHNEGKSLQRIIYQKSPSKIGSTIYSICNGCGMPTGETYSSGQLVPLHLGLAYHLALTNLFLILSWFCTLHFEHPSVNQIHLLWGSLVIQARTRQIIRYRATSTLRRPQIST